MSASIAIIKLSPNSDLAAISLMSEHMEEDMTWHLIYECEDQLCQEIFAGHPWSMMRETVTSRLLLANGELTLIVVSALIIDVESFSRTDWADGVDLDVIAEVEEQDQWNNPDEVDLGKWFPPTGER